MFRSVLFLFFAVGVGVERDWEREGKARSCEIACICVGVCVCAHAWMQGSIFVMLYVQRFDTHACIVIEGFGTLEMYLLL